VTGPTSLIPADGMSTVFVRSADEMKKAILEAYPSSNIVIMAAAVSDYRPAEYSASKLKKTNQKVSLQLKKNDDILAELGKDKNNRILVGFAVETDHIIANASKKLRSKNLDLIVVNNPNQEGSAFQFDTNQVTIINRAGEEKDLSLMSKLDVSHFLMDEIATLAGFKPQLINSPVHV
jgi:phosphopantothenoylcysteine decarboxylase/phosphopantothenate--cysteine ligase